MVFSKFLKNSISVFNRSARRYPLSIFLSIVTTVLLILLYHNSNNFSQNLRENLSRIALVSGMGISLTLCINAFSRRLLIVIRYQRYLLNLLSIFLLYCYYKFMLPDFKMQTTTRYTILNIILIILFIIIPYFFRKKNFELSIIRLISGFFTALLYSFIIFMGVSVILFTIKHLLYDSLSSKLYYDTFLILAGVFFPCYFLSSVPMEDEILTLEKDYPKLLKLLLLYILMPLLSIYTLILYFYFIKALITLVWPIQLIIHLVLWYSIISIIVIFLTSNFESLNRWVKLFNFWFIKLMLPLMIMMCIAIMKRITNYGITESRYFVLSIALWAFFSIIYLNISSHKNNLLIPLSLSLILVISVLGPLDAYNVSSFSQNQRLTKLLNKYNMIKNSKIVKSDKKLSIADKNNINNILSYFNNYHSLKDIKYLDNNTTPSDMKKIFGFDTAGGYPSYKADDYFSYNIINTELPVNIEGFSYLVDMRDIKSPIIKLDKNLEILYNDATTKISIVKNHQVLYENLVDSFGKKLYLKYGISRNQLNSKDMIFTDSKDNVTIKYAFTNINGHRDALSSSVKIDYLNFYLVIKTN